MTGFLAILALALLPVGGNLAGAAISELSKIPNWVVGAALHAAAGVAVALVSVELTPRIIDTTSPGLFIGLFATGGAIAYGLSKIAVWLTQVIKGGSAGAWMVYMATMADLLSDGLMTGASAAVSAELGLLLAMSQVVANVPGGFATIANMKAQQVPSSIRLAAAGSFLLPVILGVLVGYYALREASESAQDAALSVVVGLLVVTTIEDLVPQADKPGASRPISTTAFIVGFAFFTALSAYLN